MSMPHENSDRRCVNRRQFLENSARNAAGLAAGAVGLGAARAPNDRLQIGLIGLGTQGGQLCDSLLQTQEVEILAICDVDGQRLAQAQFEIASRQTSRPTAILDHQQLLAKPELDAVIIATPDHWHARMVADALTHNKDLFVETPVTHSLQEGELLRQLAMNSDRIIQVGLPQRSGKHYQSAIELIQNGELGPIHHAKAWAVHSRKQLPNTTKQELPVGVDYDRWLGPAERRPFDPLRFHQNWVWFWDYGSGELGLWGVQHLDVIRWGLNLGLPRSVVARGGVRSLRDRRETPDTLTVQYDFGGVDVTWEHRLWSSRGIEGRASGAAFYGELGTLVIDRSGWKVYDHHQPRFADASDLKRTQMQQFVRAVRHRTPVPADLETGLDSSLLCHLGNMASRVGREILFQPERRSLPSGSPALPYAHKAAREPWGMPSMSSQAQRPTPA